MMLVMSIMDDLWRRCSNNRLLHSAKPASPETGGKFAEAPLAEREESSQGAQKSGVLRNGPGHCDIEGACWQGPPCVALALPVCSVLCRAGTACIIKRIPRQRPVHPPPPPPTRARALGRWPEPFAAGYCMPLEASTDAAALWVRSAPFQEPMRHLAPNTEDEGSFEHELSLAQRQHICIVALWTRTRALLLQLRRRGAKVGRPGQTTTPSLVFSSSVFMSVAMLTIRLTRVARGQRLVEDWAPPPGSRCQPEAAPCRGAAMEPG